MTNAEIHPNKFFDMSFFGLRLAIGATFIVVGLLKFDPSFATYLPQMNLPAELQYLFGLEEVIPGILLIAGVLSRISASVLCLVMLGVIFYIDKVSSFLGQNGVELPVILLASSLVIIAVGPGRISLSYGIKKIPCFLQ